MILLQCNILKEHDSGLDIDPWEMEEKKEVGGPPPPSSVLTELEINTCGVT